MALRRSDLDKLISILETIYSPGAVRSLVENQRDVLEDILDKHGDLLSSTIVPRGFLRRELERRARKAAGTLPTETPQAAATAADNNPALGESRSHLTLVPPPAPPDSERAQAVANPTAYEMQKARAERRLSRREMEGRAGFRRDRLNWRQRRLCAYVFRQTRTRRRPSVPLLTGRLAEIFDAHPNSVRSDRNELLEIGYLQMVEQKPGKPLRVTLGFETVEELKSIAERVRPKRRKAPLTTLHCEGHCEGTLTTNSPQPVATAADDNPDSGVSEESQEEKIKPSGFNSGLKSLVNKSLSCAAAARAFFAAQFSRAKTKRNPRVSYRGPPAGLWACEVGT